MDNRNLKARENILQDLKKNKRDFVKRYGEDAEKVMYGTATNRAKAKIKEAVQSFLSSKPIKEMKWDDPYIKDKELIYHEPTEKEIEDFKRIDKGLPIKTNQPKPKYTGNAALQIKIGKDKWQTIKTGPVGLIKNHYKKILYNKSNYRIIYEIE